MGVSYRFWAKMWHPEEPPPRLLEAKKNTWGGVYFTWSGEIFLRNFLPYPPPNILGLKGGMFYRGYVAPEGRKVGSLKRRVRRHLGR